MRMVRRAATLFAGLILAACAPGSDDQSGPAAMPMTTYHCADGSILEVRYPTTDSARIVYQGRSFEMIAVVSASGARYVGGGWQWWTKGMTEGTLSPLAEGESIASAGGMTCTAP